MEQIKRKIKAKREEIIGDSKQYAINSWGHLTIRSFNKENLDEDTLIVFTKQETYELKSFLQTVSRGY